jgi:hypothetical protein
MKQGRSSFMFPQFNQNIEERKCPEYALKKLFYIDDRETIARRSTCQQNEDNL